MEPSSADRYIERSAMLNNNGQYDRAIADIAKAISLDPKNARAYSTRANVWENMGDRLAPSPTTTKPFAATPRSRSICWTRQLSTEMAASGTARSPISARRSVSSRMSPADMPAAATSGG